jgi:hypothetical protein
MGKLSVNFKDNANVSFLQKLKTYNTSLKTIISKRITELIIQGNFLMD